MALQYNPATGQWDDPRGAPSSYTNDFGDQVTTPWSASQGPDRYSFGGQQYLQYDPSFWSPESFYGREDLFAPFRDQLPGQLVTGPDGKQYVSEDFYNQAQGTLYPFSRAVQKNVGPASALGSRGLGILGDSTTAKLDKYDALYQAAERGYGPLVASAAIGGIAASGAGAAGAGAGTGTAASGSAPLLTTAAPVGTALTAPAAGGGIGLTEVAAGAGLAGTASETFGSDTPPPQDTAPPGGYQMGPEGEAFMNRPTTGTGGTSALGRLLGLNQTGEDALSVGGALLPALLGYFGADKQSDAYRDMQREYLALGAPSRARLESSYAPDFNLIDQPGYGGALNRIADISARSANVKFGNPYDAAAQGQVVSDVWNQGYLPALANYRGQLGQFGQFGLNTSGAAGLGGAGVAGGKLDAIGLGLGRVMGQQDPMDEALSRYYLSVGGSRV